MKKKVTEKSAFFMPSPPPPHTFIWMPELCPVPLHNNIMTIHLSIYPSIMYKFNYTQISSNPTYFKYIPFNYAGLFQHLIMHHPPLPNGWGGRGNILILISIYDHFEVFFCLNLFSRHNWEKVVLQSISIKPRKIAERKLAGAFRGLEWDIRGVIGALRIGIKKVPKVLFSLMARPEELFFGDFPYRIEKKDFTENW